MQANTGKVVNGAKAKERAQRTKDTMVGKGYKAYRSPGKIIGKGLNYWGEDDYTAAWGNEADN